MNQHCAELIAEAAAFAKRYNVLFYKAVEMAVINHQAQRYGEYPFFYHGEQVEGILREHRIEPRTWFPSPGNVSDLILEMYKDCWYLKLASRLHDILEDTPVPKGTLQDVFGYEVADLVDGVSNKGEGNRRAKFERIAPGIKGDPPRTALKLADRIGNFRQSIATWQVATHEQRRKHERLPMYLREAEWFKEQIYVDSFETHTILGTRIPEMWETLDSLVLTAQKYVPKELVASV